MANAWIEYIKKVAKETGKSYKEAMSIASDRKKKGTKIECNITATETPVKKQKKTKKRRSVKKNKRSTKTKRR